MRLKVAELFAGVGGFRLGFEAKSLSSFTNQFEVSWSNQWEPSTKKQHASEIYTARWNLLVSKEDAEVYYGRGEADDVHVNKDINTIDSDEIPDVDLLCGGFPCQNYSVAKTADKAAGIQGKKGVLWWDIRRIIEGKKPSMVVQIFIVHSSTLFLILCVSVMMDRTVIVEKFIIFVKKILRCHLKRI